MRTTVFVFFVAAVLTCAGQTGTELRLPAIFSHNMVLQQGVPVPIWGWANDGETVTVTFRDQKVVTKAAGGKWMVRLKKLKAGGPDVLTVRTKTASIQFTNVMVGEVWVCSGQSNMEWPLNRTENAEAAIAGANNPNLRLFTVRKVKAAAPTNDVIGAWVECTPETVANFSAVGYYFGRDLQAARRVPVGLIHASWGGSPAEAWMSEKVLAANPRYKAEILDGYAQAWREYEEALAKWQQSDKTARQPTPPRWRPAELYNGMIAPLMPFAIRGVIWYQGESNAERAEQYRSLFVDLIRNWRRDWGQGDFPFLCVQLAPYKAIKPEPGESSWAELREAQLLATKRLPKVGMVVITDVGDEKDIHPRKKEPVGVRLALAARGIAYGERIVYSGPVLKQFKVKGNKAILRFAHVGSGLEAKDGELKGFAICGPDKKFVWANAKIVGKDTIEVSSPLVDRPVAVRFGWADYPVVNLWNKEGLPATPFRTDNFPMITAGKK
ncbi:MAG: sialate O-acetylesterase [Verrucomicrobiae bacterium]|nr:sialate O-acetylesterase [Verrucomicrobiae bacterium]MDW7980039.1 sialate O-acetylesterase [Verrucomicrobiales bacterium]